MMSVFVLDTHKEPLMPCSEKRARLLLFRKRAVVHRLLPFTIRLKDRKREESAVQAEVPMYLKTGGSHLGRVAVRASGSFRVSKIDGINAKYCHVIQRADGYSYILKVRNAVLPLLA